MSKDKKTAVINTAKRVGTGILTFAVDLVSTSRPASPWESLFSGTRVSATDTYLSNSRRREQQEHELKMKREEHKHQEEVLKLEIKLAEAQAELKRQEKRLKKDEAKAETVTEKKDEN